MSEKKERKNRMSGKNKRGLGASIEGNDLVIRVDLKVLAFAFEHSEYNTPYQMDQQGNYDYREQFKITNTKKFAEEVVRALYDEREDGSNLMTDLMDKACQDAVESGCEGVEEIE